MEEYTYWYLVYTWTGTKGYGDRATVIRTAGGDYLPIRKTMKYLTEITEPQGTKTVVLHSWVQISKPQYEEFVHFEEDQEK